MELDFTFTGSFEDFVGEMRRNFTPEFRNQASLTVKVDTSGMVAPKCSVILTSAGQAKIQVIKAVREATRMSLKEAKDLVESAPAPVLEKVPRAEAEKVGAMLEAAGAKVTLR